LNANTCYSLWKHSARAAALPSMHLSSEDAVPIPSKGVQGLRFLQLCKYRLWSLQSLNATACKHSGKNSSGAPLAWWGGFLTPFSTYHITLLCTPSMGGQTNRHTDRHQSTGGLVGANLTPNMFDSSRQAMTASWGSCAIIECYEEKGSVAVHHS
jgi:hypothetical protein